MTAPMDATAAAEKRLQTQNLVGKKVQSDVAFDEKYYDVLSTVQPIHKEEGVGGFVKGMLPRAILCSVSSALSWMAYEFTKSLLVSASS